MFKNITFKDLVKAILIAILLSVTFSALWWSIFNLDHQYLIIGGLKLKGYEIVHQSDNWCPAKTYDLSTDSLYVSSGEYIIHIGMSNFGRARVAQHFSNQTFPEFTFAELKGIQLKQGQTLFLHLSDGSNISVWQCGLELYAIWGFG